MLARLQKSMKEKDQGFTLIELLVVIVIIGILAAIAIPMFLNQRKKGVDASIQSDLKNLATIEETYFTEKQEYTADQAVLTAAPYQFKKSPDNVFVLSVNTAKDGFCLKGSNPKGSRAGAVVDAANDGFYWYDSLAGGLSSVKPTGGVC